ncbi:C2H2-type zinc finger protein Ecym_2760 [Eremothecium cymbalariae DBVPG|uniref:C2H2-type domain-containing protein n=1 Tax=Eremothecium cymbalariae (strain CBS 270.75 / DBVPG 7215 / KCTC 17166 / NRRL Y-17582) TaxID=931890 RepID=G8JPZ6_ERECY|nr:Hypothetical protein Ecym_2760 [Eremothecium cymbalariae DBVPG\
MVASQRKYICCFCARAFSRSEHRTRHERSHTGVKPFSCKVCSHSFVRRDLLQRHIRTVHRSMLLELQLKQVKLGEGREGVLQGESQQIERVLNSFINVQSVGLRDGIGGSAGAGNDSPRLCAGESSAVGKAGSSQKGNIGSECGENGVCGSGAMLQQQLKHDGEGGERQQENKGNAGQDGGGGAAGACKVGTDVDTGSRMCSSGSSSVGGSSRCSIDFGDGNVKGCRGRGSRCLKEMLEPRFHKVLYGALSYVSQSLQVEGCSGVVEWFHEGLAYMDRERLFEAAGRAELEKALVSEEAFGRWLSGSSMLLAVVCLGFWARNQAAGGASGSEIAEVPRDDDRIVEMWKASWNQCMKKPFHESFVALNLLVYVFLRDRRHFPRSMLSISGFHQQVLHTVMRCGEETRLATDDLWTVFHLFVDLLVMSDEYSEVSLLLYQWFLGQELYEGYSLSYHLNAMTQDRTICYTPRMLETLSRSLFCETIMSGSCHTNFQYPDLLHNTIIMANKCYSINGAAVSKKEHNASGFTCWKRETILKNAPQKFFHMLNQYLVFHGSGDHWSLLLATWFEFIKRTCEAPLNVAPHLSNCSIGSKWFHKAVSHLRHVDLMQTMACMDIDLNYINNNLAIGTLPIINLLEGETAEPLESLQFIHKRMIFDVLLFNMHLFGNILFVSQKGVDQSRVTNALKMLENPIVQFLLFVWSRFIDTSESTECIAKDPGKCNMTDLEVDMAYGKHFLARYITISKIKVDTDTVIKNDLDLILFGDGVDISVFYGFHSLLGRILERIEYHMKQLFQIIVNENQNFTNLFEEALASVRAVQCELRSKVGNIMNIPRVNTPKTFFEPVFNKAVPLSQATARSVKVSPYNYSPTSSQLLSEKIILPPINFQEIGSTEKSCVYYLSDPLYSGGIRPTVTSRNQNSNCKIQLPPPYRLFNIPSTL